MRCENYDNGVGMFLTFYSSTLCVFGVAVAPVRRLDVRRTSRWFERTNPRSNPTENDRVTTIYRQNAVFRHLHVNAIRQYCKRYVTSYRLKFVGYSTTIWSIVLKNGCPQEEMLDGNRRNSDAARLSECAIVGHLLVMSARITRRFDVFDNNNW
jgi:hypothetical protein